MLRLTEVRLPVDHSEDDLRAAIVAALGIAPQGRPVRQPAGVRADLLADPDHAGRELPEPQYGRPVSRGRGSRLCRRHPLRRRRRHQGGRGGRVEHRGRRGSIPPRSGEPSAGGGVALVSALLRRSIGSNVLLMIRKASRGSTVPLAEIEARIEDYLRAAEAGETIVDARQGQTWTHRIGGTLRLCAFVARPRAQPFRERRPKAGTEIRTSGWMRGGGKRSETAPAADSTRCLRRYWKLQISWEYGSQLLP